MRFRRLHQSLGVEVIDFDPCAPTEPERVAELQRALDEHQLLVFRGGRRIPPERQVEISGWFGPVTDDSGEGRRWSVLTNADAAGTVHLPFHSDFTYTDAPIQVISLHALEIPPAGASTAFASGIRAWATLPEQCRQKLQGRTVRHRYRSSITEGLPVFVAHHPVRFVHPRTGRPVLFVTEFHADRIDGLDSYESSRLLAELFAHLYRPENVYVHRWQRWDLVLWDNLALQHARLGETRIADGERSFQRVSLNERPYAELIERARALEALRAD
jgi:taurine dioxygenase